MSFFGGEDTRVIEGQRRTFGSKGTGNRGKKVDGGKSFLDFLLFFFFVLAREKGDDLVPRCLVEELHKGVNCVSAKSNGDFTWTE